MSSSASSASSASAAGNGGATGDSAGAAAGGKSTPQPPPPASPPPPTPPPPTTTTTTAAASTRFTRAGASAFFRQAWGRSMHRVVHVAKRAALPVLAGYLIYKYHVFYRDFWEGPSNPEWKPLKYPPTRESLIAKMRGLEDFDVVVIGGGATGCGAALEAQTRGFRTALFEKEDFATGSSSKSTKMIHGGVRYLENAFLKLQLGQFVLVADALRERKRFLQNAPHLCSVLPIVTPLKSIFEIPYYLTGLKLYDWFSGNSSFGTSRYLTPSRTLQLFPSLRPDRLWGSVLYYDGQFNDSRMAVSLALTAAAYGAVALNYFEVVGLVKEPRHILQDQNNVALQQYAYDKRTLKGYFYNKFMPLNPKQFVVRGVIVRDRITKQEYVVRARMVINAAGAYADSIRRMDDPHSRPIIHASSGTHIMLGKQIAQQSTGMLIPKTEDGRMIFLLPWHGATLAGTTDNPAEIVSNPSPTNADVQYILKYLNRHVISPEHPETPLTEKDVHSAWTGLRPLVRQDGKSTASTSRDHLIMQSPSNLITIVGGKWTTYRKMGQDVIDCCFKQLTRELPLTYNDYKHTFSITRRTRVFGSESWAPTLHGALTKKFGNDFPGPVISHLFDNYGDRAEDVMALGKQHGLVNKLPFTPPLQKPPPAVTAPPGAPAYASVPDPRPDLPFTEAEALYATTFEYAMHPEDILARRMRLAFLDKDAALAAVDRVAEIMATVHGWDKKKQRAEADHARAYITKMSTDEFHDSLSNSASQNAGGSKRKWFYWF